MNSAGLSRLTLTEGSCFNLEEGSVSYGGISTISLSSSCWNISGGNAVLSNNARYLLTDKSSLHITRGSLFSQNSASLFADNSTILIDGGSLTGLDQSVLRFQNQAEVEVKSGNIIFTGEVLATVDASSFSVTGGYVEFAGNATLTWSQSDLHIQEGDMVVKGSSLVNFDESSIRITGGSLRFLDQTAVQVAESNVRVTNGNINFQGKSEVTFTGGRTDILKGYMQFTEQASAVFRGSPVYIAGQLGCLGSSSARFEASDVTIDSGDLFVKDQSALHFQQAQLRIHGGSFHSEESAIVSFEDAQILLKQGDIFINDQGSFSMLRSRLVVEGGNFVAFNPSSLRKTLTFTESDISVLKGPSSGNGGNMKIQESVEVVMRSTNAMIDGDLILIGSARLAVLEESSFVIGEGVVKMDALATIEVEANSVFLNKGHLTAPGSIRAPAGSSLTNSGVMEADHDLNANCFSDLLDSQALENIGSFRLGSAGRTRALLACVDSLEHSGLLQLSNANVTFNRVRTTSTSTTTLGQSTIIMPLGESFGSEGSLGGTGSILGGFVNSNSAVLMAHGEEGPTRLHVQGNFSNSGTMFFTVNSRNSSDPNAISQVSAGNDVSLIGGRACVCFNPDVVFKKGDSFDLVTSQTSLFGRFDQVEFDCLECPFRSAKSVASYDRSCRPGASYGGVNFAIILGACGSGSYLERISPPWYVVFPTAIGIICLLIIVLGGGLFLDEQVRKRRFNSQMRRKRSILLEKIKREASDAVAVSDRMA